MFSWGRVKFDSPIEWGGMEWSGVKWRYRVASFIYLRSKFRVEVDAGNIYIWESSKSNAVKIHRTEISDLQYLYKRDMWD